MTTKEPVAVQRYELSHDGYLLPSPHGTFLKFEDYQRDIAAAERRGAEKAREAAAKACQKERRELNAHRWESLNVRDVATTCCVDCEVAIRSLPIEQILKGE